MKEYLVFRLYAPLCSWGDITVGEIRPSSMHPSKSAMVGLLSAALGIKRDEEEKIKDMSESFGFAVLAESFGKPLTDYHTAQVPPGKERYSTRRDELMLMPKHELKTILSWRDYRTDAFYTVIIRKIKESAVTLDNIKEKLEQPEFVLYLGRKSCPPALPLEPHIVEADSLPDVVKKMAFKTDLDKLGFDKIRKDKHLYFDKCFSSEIQEQEIYERRDVPLSRKRWQFDTRKEYHAVIGG